MKVTMQQGWIGGSTGAFDPPPKFYVCMSIELYMS